MKHSIKSLLHSFYAYHTYYTLTMAMIVCISSFVNEIDNSQISFMEAFFLGITTATNTGLVTFDFSILKPTTQYIVMVASELCGVYFASTLIPSFFRFFRLKKLIKEKHEYKHNHETKMDETSTSYQSDSDDGTSFQIITSEVEPLRFDYKLELTSLKYFIFILLGYGIIFKLFGFITILIECFTSSEVNDILTDENINIPFFAAFQTISAWNNLGITLNYNGLIPLMKSETIVLTSTILNMSGNIMIPIIVRIFVFVLHRLFEPRSQNFVKPKPLLYILKAPTRMSLYFFSATQTKLLFVVQLLLIFLQMSFFVLFNTDDSISGLYVGFAHSSFTRTAGFTIVNLRDINPAINMTYILSMFISAYPIVILRKLRDNVVYQTSGLLPAQSNVTTILQYFKNLFFSHVIWWYTISMIIMAIYSMTTTTASNNLIDVLFEVSSALGTVGMSMGSYKSCASFSADLPVTGQLIICVVMILGRHRGFPTHCYPLDYYKIWEKIRKDEKNSNQGSNEMLKPLTSKYTI